MVVKFELLKDGVFPISYIGYLGLIASVIFAFSTPAVLIVGIPVSLAFIFLDHLISRKVNMLNTAEKSLTAIRGLKKEKMNYKEISGLSIQAKKVSQTFNSRGSSNTVHFTVYQGKASVDGKSILLMESKKEEKVRAKLTPLAKELGLTF